MEPILRPNPSLFEPWMLWVFLLGAIIIASIRVTYPRRLPRLFRGIIRLQMLRLIMRDEVLFSHRASVGLFINFCLSMAMVLSLSATYYGVMPELLSGPTGFIYLFAAVLLVYSMKVALMQFLSWLYRDPGPLREYAYEVVLICNTAGLVLLPLGLVLAVTNIGNLPVLFTVTAITGLGFILFRYIQGIAIGMGYRVSRLYIISYLCTLEILPIALAISAVNAAANP